MLNGGTGASEKFGKYEKFKLTTKEVFGSPGEKQKGKQKVREKTPLVSGQSSLMMDFLSKQRPSNKQVNNSYICPEIKGYIVSPQSKEKAREKKQQNLDLMTISHS